MTPDFQYLIRKCGNNIGLYSDPCETPQPYMYQQNELDYDKLLLDWYCHRVVEALFYLLPSVSTTSSSSRSIRIV